LAHLLLVFLVMRNVLLLILAVAALGWYFDFSPTDLLPTPRNTSPERVKHAPAAAPEQTPGAAPQQSSGNATAAETQDGSLANRWKPYPTASPGKP
jgi:hypothetical protein